MYYQWNCLSDLLTLCQDACYQDVTIICQNGKINVNSFLLSAVFPVLRKSCGHENQIIIVPDLNYETFEVFFASIFGDSRNIKIPCELRYFISEELHLIEVLHNNDVYQEIDVKDEGFQIDDDDTESLENNVDINYASDIKEEKYFPSSKKYCVEDSVNPSW